jgi:hypothetical protein
VRVFHRATSDTAADIRIMGFYDASDAVGADPDRMGVWVSDKPSDAREDTPTLVTLRIPIALFERHEHRHGHSDHRDALIPADDLNTWGQGRIVRTSAVFPGAQTT